MNTKSKIRIFIFVEILIWILLILLVVGLIRFKHEKHLSQFKTYRIFMQDVDGLIEGSSVRMMGVPIGFVKTINIVEDQVYVKFLITDKNVVLPQGVMATVEFNGMAGSKSLELYPPDEATKATGKLLVVTKTNRLGSALGLFDDMFAKLDSIIVRCNHFSSKLAEIMPAQEEKTKKTEQPDIEKSVSLINNVIEEIDNKRKNIMTMVKPKPKKILFDLDNTETEEESSDEQE